MLSKNYTRKVSIFFLKIRKYAFHPPFNFITELSNTPTGVEYIIKNGFIEEILNIIKSDSSSYKLKKTAIWNLAKMLKLDKTQKLNLQYGIVDTLNNLFHYSTDYGLKGCLTFIFSYISHNSDVKNEINSLGWYYFRNRNIPFQRIDLMNISPLSIKSQNFQNETIITKYINLNPINEDYYNQFCLLLNTITYKPAYSKLRELYKTNNQIFTNPKLLIKILHLLSNYRYQQQLRHFIYSVIDFGISNVIIMNEITKIVNSFGKEIL